jgi:hypothetical protein
MYHMSRQASVEESKWYDNNYHLYICPDHKRLCHYPRYYRAHKDQSETGIGRRVGRDKEVERRHQEDIGYCTGTGNPCGYRVRVPLGYGYGSNVTVPVPVPVPSLRVLLKMECDAIYNHDMNLNKVLLYKKLSNSKISCLI